MELLQVENRRLSQEIVFSNILLVVSILHFLLVDVIDELFDLVLAIGFVWLHPGLFQFAVELLLKHWGQLRDLEVFTVFRFRLLWNRF